MIPSEDFQATLARAGYEPTRSKAWADFLFSDTITPENVEGAKVLAEIIDVDVLLAANRYQTNPTSLFFMAKTFVTRIVLDPGAVQCWANIIELLQEHTHLVGHRTNTDLANVARNETFRKRLEDSSYPSSFTEWEGLVACGSLFETVAMALSFMHRNREFDTPLVNSYFKMLRRLKGIFDGSDVSVVQGDPRLIVTVHSRFRGDMVVSLVKKFEDGLYSVLANMLLTTQQVNVQRIVMLKKLKRGTSVMIAADGKKGNPNSIGRIFDRDARISDGFAWVAWKAKCPVVWTFSALAEQDVGLKSYTRVLLEAPDAEIDFETYSNQLIKAYFNAVEDAIIRHPFGFGLLYPKRIGDRQRANKEVQV